MSQRYNYIISIIGLIIFAGVIFIVFMRQNQSNLPDSFTIKFYGDFTSSGAGREYNATLTFVDNKLTNGWQRYESSSGSPPYTHKVYECVVNTKTLIWIDKATSGECGYNYRESVPLTKIQLERKIKSGEFINKPASECPHYSICYEIIK